MSTIPLAVTLGCASKQASVVEAPQCEPEPAIAVSDPDPPKSFVSIPADTELVSLRLFVVSQGEGSTDEAVPAPIRESDICQRGGCSLLLSPMFLGRNRMDMELEVGNGKNDGIFAMKANPRVLEGHVELHLEARFLMTGDPVGQTQRFAFAGTLEPGEITHVGTFYADDHRGHTVGPQVFAVVERASPGPE